MDTQVAYGVAGGWKVMRRPVVERLPIALQQLEVLVVALLVAAVGLEQRSDDLAARLRHAKVVLGPEIGDDELKIRVRQVGGEADLLGDVDRCEVG